jgi:hypothetical protein
MERNHLENRTADGVDFQVGILVIIDEDNIRELRKLFRKLINSYYEGIY